jgi:hypothetical protein
MNVTGLSKWFGLYSFIRLHRQIELFLNGVWDGDWPVEMVEFFNFLTVEIIPRGWKPYRTEWSIFDENHLVAGQIDSVWIDSNTGSLHMIDWKRCAKPLDPEDGNRFNRFGQAPCEFLLDNSFCHYAVQQNLYAAILRDCYGVTLGSMWLVQLHVDLPSYRFIPVPAFLDVAAVLLQRSAPGKGLHALDRLGGALGPAGEAEWQHRLVKRTTSVAAIKQTPEYLRCRALELTHPIANRTMSPDPADRTISKRKWETRIITWRNGLRDEANLFGPTLNICLLMSLWNLGVPVPVCGDGPFFALLDGNALLIPFNLALEWSATKDVAVGRYIRWHNNHFVAVEVFDTHIELHDRGESTSFFHLEDVVVDCTTTFFHLVQAPGSEIFDIMFSPNYDRLGGAGESQTQERCLDELLEEEEADASLELENSISFAAAMQDSVGAVPESVWGDGPEVVIDADRPSRADIPGSKTSNMDFDKLFGACSAGADATLSNAVADVEKSRSGIQERTRDLTELVTARHRAMLRE